MRLQPRTGLRQVPRLDDLDVIKRRIQCLNQRGPEQRMIVGNQYVSGHRLQG